MSSQLPLYQESQCEVRTTPLRAFNANIGIIYVALAIIAVIITWFGNTKTGGATFDTNIYRLSFRFYGNTVIPPPGTTSMVTLTPIGTSLALLGALILGGIFHFVYAVDYRRQYTLKLIDRCNGMRWAEFAIIHTILALVVAQLLGTTTFDFMFFCLLALPCLGVLGYFGDRSYPCCPHITNIVILGMALVFLAYWVPVITNFAYRNSDAGLSAPPYMWIALFSLAIFDIIVFVTPWIQARQRPSYFFIETASSAGLLVISAIILSMIGWALADQAAS